MPNRRIWIDEWPDFDPRRAHLDELDAWAERMRDVDEAERMRERDEPPPDDGLATLDDYDPDLTEGGG